MNTKIWLSILILLLILVSSAAGVLTGPVHGTIAYETIRGENAIIQNRGLYRYNPASLAQEGVVWDVINLFLGAPLLGFAIYLVRRRSLRSSLFLGGLLVYFFYTYFQYAVMLAFNPLFPVYVAIFALSLVAFFLNLNDIDVKRLPDRILPNFPHRLFIGYAFVLSAVLLLLWGRLVIVTLLSGQLSGDQAGLTTLQTQAMDLGWVAPLGISTGLLMLRRSAWGYLLGSICVTFGLLMSILIPAWMLMALVQSGKANLLYGALLLAVAALGLFVCARFYRSVEHRSHSQEVRRRKEQQKNAEGIDKEIGD